MTRTRQLSKAVAFQNHIVPILRAAATTVDGTAVDMQGYDSVMFVMQVGAVAAGGDITSHLEVDDDVAFGSHTDVTGSTLTLTNTDANLIHVWDVHRPKERYIRLEAVTADQNTTFGVMAYRYNGRLSPPTTSGAANIAALVTPESA